MEKTAFVKNLERRMKELAIPNANQLSVRSGISPSTVHKVLKGDISPTIETVGKFAKAVKSSPSELLADNTSVGKVDVNFLQKTMTQVERLIVKHNACIFDIGDKVKLYGVWYNMGIANIELDDNTLDKQFFTLLEVLDISYEDDSE